MSLPVVLINGWAMPEAVIDPLSSLLRASCSLTVIALPDRSWPDGGDDSLASLVAHVHRQMPDSPFLLAGWSYGGSLATVYARTYPQQVKGLVTLATNPCFVASEHWHCAMAAATFADFVQGMQQQPEKTLKQFASLCRLHGDNSRQQARRLYQAFIADGLNSAGLLSVLKRLGPLNLCPYLQSLRCPSRHIFARQDALVPSAAARAPLLQSGERAALVREGSHCFFLDNPAQAAEDILQFKAQLVR